MSIQEITMQGSNVINHNGSVHNEVKSVDTSIVKVKERIQTELGYMPTLQEKTIISAIEQANKKLEGADREFEFSVHEKTKQIMVKVLDKESKEVVREIPSEKILDMVAAMCENAGLFVDEKL